MHNTKSVAISMFNLIHKTGYRQIQLVTCLIFSLFLNCTNVQEPEETFSISYPLSVGKTWIYETVNLRLSKKSLRDTTFDTTFDTSILKRTIIQKDMDISGLPVYTFEDSLKLDIVHNYYQQKNNGIYSYIMENCNMVTYIDELLDVSDNVCQFLLIPSTFKCNQTWETKLFPNSKVDSIASIAIKISFKGEEKVITKAGVFNCFIFEKCGDTEKSVLYVAPDIGIVKQVFYSCKGNPCDKDCYFYPFYYSIAHDSVGIERQMLNTQSISLISYN